MKLTALLLPLFALTLLPHSSHAMQPWNGQKIYFGDTHFHSCLSWDATGTLDDQFGALLYDHGCDFGAISNHAEGARKDCSDCKDPYPWWPESCLDGEVVAQATKDGCDDWNGRTFDHGQFGNIDLVTFPGYEWAPEPEDYREGDSNADSSVPGHVNYFFDSTEGWNYSDDVWGPGHWLWGAGREGYDEIMGQLLHQRDDPCRPYDVLIQADHPGLTEDWHGSDDNIFQWSQITEDACTRERSSYGLHGVEWIAAHEAALGATVHHESEFHHKYHRPEDWVVSRALRDGYRLAALGGSDDHDSGAGGATLTAVYASTATRKSLWAGLQAKRTYTLSRPRGKTPVHKGRVDFRCRDTSHRLELAMGGVDPVEPQGGQRTFLVMAGGEVRQPDIYPWALRLYRVRANTPLESNTHRSEIGLTHAMFGELLGETFNWQGQDTYRSSWTVKVMPGDAVFAVVEYSDRTAYQSPTYARTTPIWFDHWNESVIGDNRYDYVTFRGHLRADARARGGMDIGRSGDVDVLSVGGGKKWPEVAEWDFYLDRDREAVSYSFLTESGDGGEGHLFSIRIDGHRLYSGRGGIDHADHILETRHALFPLARGLHRVQVHMDDQRYDDYDDDFSACDYDGPVGFLDALRLGD